MAAVDVAIDRVLKFEGGFVVDCGGPTNFGITLKAAMEFADHDVNGRLDFDLDFDGDVDIDDIKRMTESDARRFYAAKFFEWKLDRITSTPVSSKFFDLGVNMGFRQATKIVQRGLRAIGAHLNDDGGFGPVTLNALQDCVLLTEHSLLAAIRSESAGFYRLIAGRDPVQFGKYLEGWLNRAYSA